MTGIAPSAVRAGDAAVPFDPAAPLPRGVTLLEASAGTGKTYTIANLAVRYLAEGTPIDQLLVVTFTRSATGELRDRVRARLVAAEAGLRAAAAGVERAGEAAGADGTDGADKSPVERDELVDLLAEGSVDDVARRLEHLSAALADFDAATISTIHGFCEQVLTSLGTAADCGRDLRFVEDNDGLVDEVVDDLYLRKFRGWDHPTFTRKEARQIVATAVANRDAFLEPALAGRDTPEGLRASLAARGRDEVIRRSRQAGTIGWDDQIARLAATLDGPSGDTAVGRLRRRFSVVLVDEFQDTDQQQWDIFRKAFAAGDVPLLLIGDPKQAIYSFRGADVWTYLAARATAGQPRTLGTNWRSDQPLLDALDALMSGATLGHPEIPYRTVTAAAGHDTSRLAGAPSPAPLRLRLLHRGDGLIEQTAKGWAQADSARLAVAADVADDIVALVSSGATLPDERPAGGSVAGAACIEGPGGIGARDATGRAPRRRGLTCGDVAVLVRANHEAATIHRALDAAGVPAVIAGGGSVFATPAAGQWLTLLEALEQPAATARARAAALTAFIGWDAATLVQATDAELDGLQAVLHRWAAVLAERGVAALTETVAVEQGLVARELACVGGERRLTDLRHVAELLHAEALQSGAGGRALTAWLRDRVDSAGSDTAAEERSRRLESDAEAVQIQTVHRSKGLEYPVVYLPYLWHAFPDKDAMPLYHDPDAGDRRTIDVGGDRPDGWWRHRARAAEERRGEDLRQAYVAFTRARHQVVVWWATGHETTNAPLARLLLGRAPAGSMSPKPAAVPKDDDVVEARMHELAARAAGTITVERVGAPTRGTFQPAAAEAADLDVDRFERTLDVTWRRTSYTGLTAAAHGAARPATVASEAETPGLTDEPAAPDALADAALPLTAGGGSGGGGSGGGGESKGAGGGGSGGGGGSAVTGEASALPSPMAALPAGAAFGITVHAMCEAVDFSVPDLPAALSAALAAVTGRAEDPTLAGLPSALQAVIETPLGPLAGGRRLRDVGRADRLDELAFELPLVGGDTPRAQLALADIAGCMRRHLPAADPLGWYPDRLADPAMAQLLRGYLVGSIDLVLRLAPVPGGDGPAAEGRFVVVDYKTNWLGSPGEALTTWHYRPARMAEAMAAEHYPLQAVLYSVALHRYLRWRLTGYDPRRHLGGVLYLFLRGMAGAATPVEDGNPAGVFAWEPPAAMIVELSDLLDRGVP
ncbi:UvrD-helicase domain-containing protein [Acidiferrimicrobium sp. IK]|uniref:UvrD-helicase domain-containing protein n=1 Tax=Acidiferrimicrobium sp. IK TaxID=2871700 RepID=UPI0021CB6DF2|nr:UvrD-helicase domain-containing protein [Acidiferrimicrobium sp. IK]MCU4186036.1 UvrD-helicase domain-containing protein [Acidiferrimicrobium sp. IK]